MTKLKTGGRPAIFKGVVRQKPITVALTPVARKKIAAERRWLAKELKRKVTDVSWSATVEALARGRWSTLSYLKKTGQIP